MLIKRITSDSKEFNNAWKILSSSIPSGEIRNYAGEKALFKNKAFRLFGAYLDSKLIGFAAVFVLKEFVFIDDMAILKGYRNKGYGTLLIKDIIINSKSKPVILETEKPENKQSKRRIRFYRKNGFYLNNLNYLLPGLRKNNPSVPMILMSYPKKLKQKEFSRINKIIYQKVYKIKK